VPAAFCLLAKFPQIFKRKKIEFEVISGVFNDQVKKGKNGLTAIFACSEPQKYSTRFG
jgi:hypothetical protein